MPKPLGKTESPVPPPYPRLEACRACPRLAVYLAVLRDRYPEYHCRPVAPWGRSEARLLIVGLAPGLHGANRSGRPFTGDASGRFLFAGLERWGFASHADPDRATLRDTRITNAVRCVPPDNRPLGSEVRRCSPYLIHEIEQLWRPRVRRPRCILALGRVAHQAVGIALKRSIAPFGHGLVQVLARNLVLVDTYHPSRQNTNTRRLTAPMLDDVLGRVRGVVGGPVR